MTTTALSELAKKLFEAYSRNSGNPPDCHHDRNAAEQWMAQAMEECRLSSAEPVALGYVNPKDVADGTATLIWPKNLAAAAYVPVFAHAQPAVPVESLGRDAPDPVPLNAVRAALEAVDTGRTQIARDNLRILEIHLRAQSGKPVASVPDVFREHGNSALAHISNALDDLESSPDQRPVPLLNEAMFHIREMLSPTNQEGAAP